jgi:hypothetical protein
MRRNSPRIHRSCRKRHVTAAGQAAVGDTPDQAEIIPTGANYEIDIAPDLVIRGPDDRYDRTPICSLPSDSV